MELNAEKIYRELRMFVEDMPTDLHLDFTRTVKFRDFLKDTLALIKQLAVEKKNLEYTLFDVMRFVDKWLDGAELEQDEVNRAATMREKTLQIVERLTEDVEWSAKRILEADKKIAELTEENERLNGKVAMYEEERKYHFAMSRKRIAESKADTVREMQEGLHGRFGDDANRVFSNYNIHRYIDQIAKAMLEGEI